MIKFPSTLSEYTDGKLWREGVDESIARRILVDYHKLEDKNEMLLRRMYLAYFYFDIGEYRIATTLAKTFLLERQFVDDAINLLKKIYFYSKDADGFSKLIKLIGLLYGKEPIENFFDYFEDMEDIEISEFFQEFKGGNKGRVVFNGEMAEYYRDGKFIFSVENRDGEAVLQNSLAGKLLSDNQPESVLAFLSNVKFSKVRPEIASMCRQTIVKAHLMLDDVYAAYEQCKFLIDDGVFMPEMIDICSYLYKKNSPEFAKLKEFLQNYKGYSNAELNDLHALSRDINDKNFWKEICEDNPIMPLIDDEETFMLKGSIAFNDGKYDLADKTFKQATSLFGRFGKSWLFRYYVEQYLKKLNKSGEVDDMSQEVYSSYADEVYSYIDKKLFPKLKRCRRRADFVKNADELMLELDNMLSSGDVKIEDIIDITNRVYKMNYTPACEMMIKIAVDGDYNALMRAICFANFLLYGKSSKILYEGEIYDNALTKIFRPDVDESKEAVAYGFAMYIALSIFQNFSNKELSEDISKFRRIYAKLEGDYSKISPMAVFGVMSAYFSQAEVHYIKKLIKKKEVKVFAQAILNDASVREKDFLDFCARLI